MSGSAPGVRNVGGMRMTGLCRKTQSLLPLGNRVGTVRAQSAATQPARMLTHSSKVPSSPASLAPRLPAR